MKSQSYYSLKLKIWQEVANINFVAFKKQRKKDKLNKSRLSQNEFYVSFFSRVF